MVKLGTVPSHFDAGQNYIVSLTSLGVVLCLVVAVLGIKFRWFKQRLNFEPVPTGASGSGESGVVLKRASRSSQEQFCEPVVVQGVFRKKLDEDVIIERPKTLPPVRIRKASRGAPSFGPPKRTETPVVPVEEPMVVPPPPPPLPTSSSIVSLPHNGSSGSFLASRMKSAPKEETKVSFHDETEIIANGDVEKIYEELKTQDDHSALDYSERRPTGYVRASEAMLEELRQLEREPPEAQPRTTTAERQRETFKKHISKSAKITMEPLKGDDDQIEDRQVVQRRLTGFYPQSSDEREHMEELLQQGPDRKVAFHLNDDDNDEDDEDEGNKDEESNIPSPPVLLSTQLSTEEERNASDSWSAIQRHRNLAQEISEQHEAMQNRRREKAEASSNGPVPQFRNPLAGQQQHKQQPKPRTMRDMKRNNAKNDLLLDNDRHDFEA